MKNYLLYAVSGLIILLAIAVLFLVNLTAAKSETRANASVSTVQSRSSEPSSLGTSKDLFVFAEGDAALTRDVARTLATGTEPVVDTARVVLLTSAPNAQQRPALIIALEPEHLLWTPLYSRARLRLRFAYATDPGDLSTQASGRPEVVNIGREPTIRVQGEVTLIDDTRGFTSRPGYLAHLSHAAALQLRAQLRSALAQPPAH